jgi:hypothetical protein
VAAVVCVSGPTARILDRLDEMGVATRDAAHQISERMRGTENQLQRNREHQSHVAAR